MPRKLRARQWGLAMADDPKNRLATDEEITELAEVIARHCPLRDQCEGDHTDKEEAEQIAAKISPNMRRFKSWNEASEAGHLEAWKSASRKLRDEFLALDQTVRVWAINAATPLLTSADLRSRPHLINLHHIIEALPDIVEQSVTIVKKRLNEGAPTGHTNWLEINIADECREVWLRRTGKEAPRLISNTGKFSGFLHDVFEKLKLKGKPIPAMQAWSKIQS